VTYLTTLTYASANNQ